MIAKMLFGFFCGAIVAMFAAPDGSGPEELLAGMVSFGSIGALICGLLDRFLPRA